MTAEPWIGAAFVVVATDGNEPNRARPSEAFVALMLQGFAAPRCKPLKHNENSCDIVRQGFGRQKFKKCLILLVAEDGFEPPTHGL
jgi:hypothetical protein